MKRPAQPPESLVGAPYKRGGLNDTEGFDCFTLLEYVRRVYYGRKTPHAGIPAPELTSTQAAALAIYRATGGRENVPSPWVACTPDDGCAVAMAISRYGRLHHCGVLVGENVLHALENVGVVMTPALRIPDVYSRVEFFECRSWL